jgi:hypothetical protein
MEFVTCSWVRQSFEIAYGALEVPWYARAVLALDRISITQLVRDHARSGVCVTNS